MNEIKLMVRELMNDQFDGAVVERVDVVKDLDFDGDPVYRVLIVLPDPDRLDSAKLGGFVRHMRARLGSDSTFPIVSFRSLQDDRGITSEAA